MTTDATLTTLADIVADLSRELPADARFRRLLDAIMDHFPCDATALLKLEGEYLVPQAIKGLSRDTLGRRFALGDQPRLQEIMNSRGPVRFPAESPLPDPYDGLVEREGPLHVHDCLGVALHVDGEIWGALTLDALSPRAFGNLDPQLLRAFASVAAASIRAIELIQALESKLDRHRQVQRSWLSGDAENELTGESGAMRRLRGEIEVVAPSELSVLIQGETGVGKELVARAILSHSPRAEQPMIQVNCAALPESLAESELFGHLRGSFSGAEKDRPGKFEVAHQGTLLLDEVGELPLQVQAKLLRVLQSGEIQRVGSDRTHAVDVRIIAVTNRDLRREVAEGRFRDDLYHRLSVYPLTVPPLREREHDVTLLAGCFMERCARKLGLRGLRMNAAARRWLIEYDWPGNVRELEHAISRAAVRSAAEQPSRDRVVELDPRHLGAQSEWAELVSEVAEPAVAPAEATLAEALESFKRRLIGERVRTHDGNLAAAARSLGVDRGNFYRQVKRLGLR